MSTHPQGHPHEPGKYQFCRYFMRVTPEMMTEDAKFALGF
jgi:hypothetical protein